MEKDRNLIEIYWIPAAHKLTKPNVEITYLH